MYRVILSLDANFRLSNRLTRSSNRTDPNLTEGKAYMVPEDDYSAHIKDTEGAEAETVCIPAFSSVTQVLIGRSRAAVRGLEPSRWPIGKEAPLACGRPAWLVARALGTSTSHHRA